MKIYTGKGDDGSTGLYFGGRVQKSSDPIEVNGAVDEAQAALGWARSLSEPGSQLNEVLIEVERGLWTLMANVATLPENWSKLEDGTSRVTNEMVSAIETEIDHFTSQIEMPNEFVVPGENQLSAALDMARTVVRRAERIAVGYEALDDTPIVPYLNRLSDLAWTLARYAEGPYHRTARRH
jgi:cob(I)alamin adenosyltransferase